MTNQYVKPYLDSSVFIAWINDETFRRDGSSCKKVVDHIMALAGQGVYRIMTSAWTLAEVYKKKKENPLDDVKSKKILAYFENDYIELVDVNRLIGEEAHELARTYKLKPTDSVHLACALRAKCDILLAYDPDFLDMNPKPSNIQIDYPRIIPKKPTPLFDHIVDTKS